MTIQIADSDTLLGQRQRGLGRRYLAAKSAAGAADLLLHCIEKDPRWDRQIEGRKGHYARLALEVELPVSAVVAA